MAILKLCTPALIYLVISSVVLLVMGYQNIGNNTAYCAGDYSCAVSSTSFVFVIKMLYVLFWTWVLNLICKAGGSIISWVFVLLPLLIMFLLIGLYMIGGSPVVIPFSKNVI